MSANIKRFILLGQSGAGKSSFINAFYNYCYGTRNPDDIFGEDQQDVKLAIPCKNWVDRTVESEKSSERDINDQSKSQTINCALYKLRLDKVTIELIDTPGFNDCEGVAEDDAVLHEIEQVLQNISFLSGIIVVVNGSTSRLGTAFLHFMRLLREVCPNSLMENICTVLTNCDDVSCNLDSEILRNDLKVKETTTFYMQNSLFRWDRTTRTSKIIRNFRRDFDDSISTLDNLVSTLGRFDNVSTDEFRLAELKRRRIQKCIATSIQQIIDLLKVNRTQRVLADGLNGAKATMAANRDWTKQTSINAFRWMEVEPSQTRQQSFTNNNSGISSAFHTEKSSKKLLSGECDTTRFCVRENMGYDTSPTQIKSDERDLLSHSHHKAHNGRSTVHSHVHSGMKEKSHVTSLESPEYQYHAAPRGSREYQRQNMKLEVTLDDNEAKSHHETAQRQAKSLKVKATEFADKHNELIISMISLLDDLEHNVHDMRKINSDIDLLERNMDSIQKLREEIKFAGDEPTMISFFNEVIQILSKPTGDGEMMLT